MTVRLAFSRLLPKRWSGWVRQIDFIRRQYGYHVRRELRLTRLFRPQRFSEKVQWRKLFDARKIFQRFSDRIAVQSFIRDGGFGEMLVPPIWIGDDPRAIPFDDLPRPFVLKSTHASGQVIIVREDGDIDRPRIIEEASAWLKVCYGTELGERGYLGVPRRLVVEPLLICRDGNPPVELKVFVFNGVARVFQYNAIDENRKYKIGYLDRDWNLYQWHTTLVVEPEKPACFDLAVRAAETLCARIDHCRVDFYIVDDTLYIGEMTPYSWSGLLVLNAPHTDIILGSFWKLRFPVVRALRTMAFSDWAAK